MNRNELRNWIVVNLYKEGKIIQSRMKRWSVSSLHWTEKHHPEIHLKLIRCVGRSFSEQIYLLINDLTSIPKCKGCENSVHWISFDKGHYDYCSAKCTNTNATLTKIKVTNKRTKGGYKQAVINAKETFRKKYGVDWMSQSPGIIQKRIDTNLQKYGTGNTGTIAHLNKQRKETCVARYGVEYPLQNEEIHQRALHNGLGRSKVKWMENHSIWYQGTYEKKFLELMLTQNRTIQRGKQLTYTALDGKQHKYTPDFIVDNSEIYEVKSNWTWDNKGKNKKLRVINKLKLKAAKQTGCKTFLVLEGKIFQYSDVIKQKELQP